jgi:transcriptional regulator with XRE-family HTH domain
MPGNRRLFQSAGGTVAGRERKQVLREDLFHTGQIGGNFPHGQGEISPSHSLPQTWDISHVSTDLKTIVASRLAELERNSSQAAKLGGLERSFVRDILNGKKRSVGADKLEKLAIGLDLSIEELSSTAEPRRVSLEEEWREEQASLPEQNGYGRVEGGSGGYRPTTPGAIPEINVMAGAGEGEVGGTVQLVIGKETYVGHSVVAEWVFPEPYFLNELHATRGKTHVMPVIGDSMEPTYRPGDRILVDTSQTDIMDDTVFVISDGMDVPKIKRLSPIFGSSPRMVQIVSDNPRVPTQTYPLAEITIIGRVVGVVSRR